MLHPLLAGADSASMGMASGEHVRPLPTLPPRQEEGKTGGMHQLALTGGHSQHGLGGGKTAGALLTLPPKLMPPVQRL